MAKNAHIAHTGQRARSLPVPNGRKAGDPVKVGAMIGVLITARVPTDPDAVDDNGRDVFIDYGNGNAPGFATVARDGAWHLSVAGPQADTYGATVYIKDDQTLTTDTTGSPTRFGFILGTKPANAATVIVELALV